MTDFPTPAPDPTRPAREPARCKRHDWTTTRYSFDPPNPRVAVDVVCSRCGALRDVTRVRRGRSSRRLGNDQERRAERTYGWRKVGEFGGITDLEDDMFVVQQKATRAAPPVRWTGIFDRLAERAGGRTPLILLSFVRNGVPTEDFVVVRGRDWRALHGGEE